MRIEKLQDLLEWTDGTEEYEKNFLDKISLFEDIIIFGAGIGGQQTYYFLKKKGYEKKIRAFTDNNLDKIGKIYIDYPVISPNDIINFDTALIVICSTAYDIILQQVINLGIKKTNIYYFQPAGLNLSVNSDMNFIRDNIDEFEYIYQLLADEKSKEIFKCLLNYRISKRIYWLDEMKDLIDDENNQYFDQDILKQYIFDEGFVDVGAYIGDTVEQFFKFFPNWEGNYYCIEADKKNYKRLNEWVEAIDKKIIRFNCAVWDHEGELRFDSTSFAGSVGSKVSSEGELVKCHSIDYLLKNERIDFLKMDIEGAEKKALLGAKEVINKNNPILAICIYHKQEDYFKIPLVIQQISNKKYDFYIRQYRYGISETVLYAMPTSRKKSLIGKKI